MDMDTFDHAFRDWWRANMGAWPENAELREKYASAFLAGAQAGVAEAQKLIGEQCNEIRVDPFPQD